MNELETDVARELFHIGMASAAKSLAFFTQETMHLQYFDLKLFSGSEAMQYFDNDILNKNIILTTDLIGDFTGKSYLLFSQEEVDAICRNMFPPSILEDPEQAAMMADNLMLELDNIVSAAAVTQFANLLSCKLHGGVPDLQKIPFRDFIAGQMEANSDLFALLFTVRFTTGATSLEPSFVWFVDEDFFTHVQNIIHKEDALKALLNSRGELK